MKTVIIYIFIIWAAVSLVEQIEIPQLPSEDLRMKHVDCMVDRNYCEEESQ
jgi:hypothetical protein